MKESLKDFHVENSERTLGEIIEGFSQQSQEEFLK